MEKGRVSLCRIKKKLFRPLGLEAKVEDGGFLFKLKCERQKKIFFFRHFFHEMIENQIIQIQMFGI